MAQTATGPNSSESFKTLKLLLETASNLVGELATDRLFARLLAVFARMPGEDREPILGILEREVDARHLTDATAKTMSGIRLHPNPSARIYARAIDQDVEAPLNRQETVMASVRAMRMFHRAVGPVADIWAANLYEAFRGLEGDELESIEGFARLLIEQIDRCKGNR